MPVCARRLSSLAAGSVCRTVAEGIETTHESHKLQSIGCQVGQGYLFAKPMPKSQLIGICAVA